MSPIQEGWKGTFGPVLCGQSGPASIGWTPGRGFLGRKVWLGLRGWVWWPREGEVSSGQAVALGASGLSCPGLPTAIGHLVFGEGTREVFYGHSLLPALWESVDFPRLGG